MKEQTFYWPTEEKARSWLCERECLYNIQTRPGCLCEYSTAFSDGTQGWFSASSYRLPDPDGSKGEITANFLSTNGNSIALIQMFLPIVQKNHVCFILWNMLSIQERAFHR